MTKVTVYTTPTCPRCHLVKIFLDEHKIDFEDIDLSKDRTKAEELIEKTGQREVPMIQVGDTIVVGFDKEKLSQTLGI